MRISKLTFGFMFACFALSARETHYLGRSPQALLMGDAFTARADDEYSLFYNPASLGRTKGLSLTPINPEFGLTNALDEMDKFQNIPQNDTAALSERFMGTPVYLHASAMPNVKMGGFGLSLFLNTTTSLVLRNAVHPIADIDYRYDRGFTMGYAYSWGTAGKKKKKKDAATTSGYRTSIGASVKHVRRSALVQEFPLFGTSLINTINKPGNKDWAQIRNSLGYSEGSAWGGDLGIEHSIVRGPTEIAFGLSAMDIGDLQFRRLNGTGEIPRQPMTINGGMTFRQDFKIFDYSLSADIHPMNQYMPLGRRIHIGAEAGIPLVRVFAGYSEGYLSYGAQLNVYMFKLTAGFYGVELGSEYKEEKGSRALIYLSLFDFSFDA